MRSGFGDSRVSLRTAEYSLMEERSREQLSVLGESRVSGTTECPRKEKRLLEGGRTVFLGPKWA